MGSGKLTRYRICPHGADKWKVQRRGHFGLWRDVGRYHHEFMFRMIREFDAESDAERWIEDAVNDDNRREYEAEMAAMRRRTIPPRGYP